LRAGGAGNPLRAQHKLSVATHTPGGVDDDRLRPKPGVTLLSNGPRPLNVYEA
jgi:hypothetical protein